MPWFKVENDIIDKHGAELGAYGLAVYMCISRFINQEGVAWPSYETIAKRTGISRRKVISEVQKLVDLGLVEVTQQFNPHTGEHRSNLFSLPSASYAPPPNAHPASPSEPRTPRKRLKKDYSPSNVKEEKKSYQPADYGFV